MFKRLFFALITACFISQVSFAQLLIGGYGEIALSRNFFSDNINRYSHATDYKNAPNHGRFDMPHVAFAIGYNFNSKWKMYSEIEFEHGGTESAMELEAEEAGEYEREIERGGEVALEQFWIERTFSPAFNLRMGHIIVPIGYTNGNHLPNEFFTVYRPEGENTIFPCTWHETGVSLWGNIGKWRYEAQLLPGLDSELFSRQNWIQGGSASPYEFKVANKYAGVLRIDNYSINGLRMGLSGYFGYSFNNSIQPSSAEKYKSIKGAVGIGSFDFEYKKRRVIARGYFDYGHLSDSEEISKYNKSLTKNSPSPRTNVASGAIATGLEAGYDIFPLLTQTAKEDKRQLFIFSRYEYYDSMYKTAANITDNEWCGRRRAVIGLNYFPVREVVIKAEYSAGILKSQYNNENNISVGIAYSGFFTK
ncbi:MAG: hypothetical protein LBR97_07065 [Dysgonamonadaceae bacterium]|jgi:hypothetical protein|nr:hypothetical protein [Dysgonamonadaceae bacterium]